MKLACNRWLCFLINKDYYYFTCIRPIIIWIQINRIQSPFRLIVSSRCVSHNGNCKNVGPLWVVIVFVEKMTGLMIKIFEKCIFSILSHLLEKIYLCLHMFAYAYLCLPKLTYVKRLKGIKTKLLNLLQSYLILENHYCGYCNIFRKQAFLITQIIINN